MPSTSKREAGEATDGVGLLQRLDKLLGWIALFGGGVVLSFLTVFSAFNVLVMRKAQNDPIKGAEDLLVLALVVLVALAIPYGARTGAHIEVEVLEHWMSKAFACRSMVAMKLVGCAVVLVLAWRLLDAGANAAEYGESSQTLLISFTPFYFTLAIGLGLYGVVLLLEIWQLVRHGEVRKLRLPEGTL